MRLQCTHCFDIGCTKCFKNFTPKENLEETSTFTTYTPNLDIETIWLRIHALENRIAKHDLEIIELKKYMKQKKRSYTTNTQNSKRNRN